MDAQLANTLLGISGVVVMLLLAVIGYFLRTLHGDVKQLIMETGKNKGRIELVEKQLENDVKRIELVTQTHLSNLTENVNRLSTSVETLVLHLGKIEKNT